MRVNSKTTQTLRKMTYITIRMAPYNLFAWNFLRGMTMKEFRVLEFSKKLTTACKTRMKGNEDEKINSLKL